MDTFARALGAISDLSEQTFRAFSIFLIAIAWVASANVSADTITIAPANPTTADSISFRVDGVSSVSMAIVITSNATIIGDVIRLDGCTSYAGFATPSPYVINYAIGTLPSGAYTVQYYHASCDVDGTVLTPYAQTASQTFSVAAGPSGAPIPSLSNLSLVILAAVLVIVVMIPRSIRG